MKTLNSTTKAELIFWFISTKIDFLSIKKIEYFAGIRAGALEDFIHFGVKLTEQQEKAVFNLLRRRIECFIQFAIMNSVNRYCQPLYCFYKNL